MEITTWYLKLKFIIIIIIIIIYSLRFFPSVKADHLSLEFEWQQVSFCLSGTLLSILADFNNAVVWMVSTRLLIPKSSSPFNNPSVTVPWSTFTTGIKFTFMFHSFFFSIPPEGRRF